MAAGGSELRMRVQRRSAMNVLHVLAALVVAAAASVYEPHRTSQCEPITIEACQDMPYNVTRMPNIVKHETQAEAAELVS